MLCFSPRLVLIHTIVFGCLNVALNESITVLVEIILRALMLSVCLTHGTHGIFSSLAQGPSRGQGPDLDHTTGPATRTKIGNVEAALEAVSVCHDMIMRISAW